MHRFPRRSIALEIPGGTHHIRQIVKGGIKELGG